MGRYNYVGFWKRLLAIVLDSIFLMAPLILLFFGKPELFQREALIVRIYMSIVSALYFIITTWLMGGTFGKRILELRVVDYEGHSLKLLNSILRHTPFIVLNIVSNLFYSNENGMDNSNGSYVTLILQIYLAYTYIRIDKRNYVVIDEENILIDQNFIMPYLTFKTNQIVAYKVIKSKLRIDFSTDEDVSIKLNLLSDNDEEKLLEYIRTLVALEQ